MTTRGRISLMSAALAAGGLLVLTSLVLVTPAAEGKVAGGTYLGAFGGHHAGNMQFTVSTGPAVSNFRVSKMRIVCRGRLYHVSVHADFSDAIHHRFFRFRGT